MRCFRAAAVSSGRPCVKTVACFTSLRVLTSPPRCLHQRLAPPESLRLLAPRQLLRRRAPGRARLIPVPDELLRHPSLAPLSPPRSPFSADLALLPQRLHANARRFK